MELQELIERHEDVQEVTCPAPEMSRITFQTYEEITLDIPIDDTYKAKIYHTNIDIQPTRQTQQHQQGQKQSSFQPITWLRRLMKILIISAVIGNLAMFIWLTNDRVSTYLISHFKL